MGSEKYGKLRTYKSHRHFKIILVAIPTIITLSTTKCYQLLFHTNFPTINIITKSSPLKWSESNIAAYMKQHPQRAYFSRLMVDGGFQAGMEVGAADGRFTQHFLQDMKRTTDAKERTSSSHLQQWYKKWFPSRSRQWAWTMVEPYPNDELNQKYDVRDDGASGQWNRDGLLENVDLSFIKRKSLSYVFDIPDESHDFIYLDGDHSFAGVKAELPRFWDKVREGGVLAGSDYCNIDSKKVENSLPCKGCENVPKCQPSTELGVSSSGKDIVKAVQEWLMEKNDDRLTLYHIDEDFTNDSLSGEITNTRNPSWFIVKPLN